MQFIVLIMISYASVNSSSTHPPPPGNRWAFAHVVSPGGGALAILTRTPGRPPRRAFDTRVFKSVFKGMFSQFQISLHYL